MAKKESIDLLIKTSAVLQKNIANLTLKVNSLTKQLSALVEIFSEAAKPFLEKNEREKLGKIKIKKSEIKESSDVEEKINTLIEQNKVIAKGLLLLEKFVKEKLEEKPKKFETEELESELSKIE